MGTTIILYHGSNRPVYDPDVNRNQAEKWARRKAKYLGRLILNRYAFNTSQPELKILIYQTDTDWVKFVIRNRIHSLKTKADIVIGPTADGKLFLLLISGNMVIYI